MQSLHGLFFVPRVFSENPLKISGLEALAFAVSDLQPEMRQG
ncbi:hypothetical protein [Geoalkalibacter halelectricus]|nr:hypothetical protein [Geoalkalibacter halelectricus]